jgi:hypothetical protein
LDLASELFLPGQFYSLIKEEGFKKNGKKEKLEKN